MEVHHHPRPWGDWREFLREYLIVVVGVMTALAAEQVAEWLHWRHEVKETRQALNQEVAFDLASAEWHAAMAACKLKRLDAIEHWRMSIQAGKPEKLAGPMALPPDLIYLTASWRAANGSAVGQLPVEERNAYATYYDLIDVYVNVDSRERERWASLQKSTYFSRWDESQLAQIEADIEALRAVSQVYAVNMIPVRGTAAAVGVTAADGDDSFNKTLARMRSTQFAETIRRAPSDLCRSPFAEP
jgi:hypothetical protein